VQTKPVFRKIDLGRFTTYLRGPAVLQIGRPAKDDLTGYIPIVGLGMVYNEATKTFSVAASGVYREREYDLKSIKDFKFVPTLNKITFEFQGTIYTVRPFTDNDGYWASYIQNPVPSDVLEDILVNSYKVEIGEEQPFMNESLTALADDKTKEVVYLLYTGADKTFARKSGSWLELNDPNGDLLDGLNVYEVKPEFVQYYDKNNGKVSEKDAAKFEIEVG
jgi:hypothetical protein